MNQHLSYWEIESWLNDVDFTIVGSGIVGLSCALELKRKFFSAKILVLEKGSLPHGASTKNAGFACFGSLSEILDDLKSHSEDETLQLIEKRWKGLQLLRKSLGDNTLDYKPYGGYELFRFGDSELFEICSERMIAVNQMLKPIFGSDVFSFKNNNFNFGAINPKLIFNQFEGQIDTGKMMDALLKTVAENNIKILNNVTVEEFSNDNLQVKVKTNQFEFKTSRLLIATNGFASKLNIENVKPARAQVLITNPIQDLKIKGTFHLEQGYYYFRNINNRILLGGGRNLDKIGETTTEFGQTDIIQNKLEILLKSTILPNQEFEIEHRWSGIMGVGSQKAPIVKQLSDNVFCGVRLGGMGVAIGSLVGKELADLTTE